jgi:hypothetical protein
MKVPHGIDDFSIRCVALSRAGPIVKIGLPLPPRKLPAFLVDSEIA